MKYFALLFSAAGLVCAADFYTGQAARALIGQPTFTRQNPGASEFLLGAVSGLAYANDILVVSDSNRIGASPQNNRVLIYRNISQQIPGPNDSVPQFGDRCAVCGGRADVVLGQPDFTKTDIGLSQTKMRTPTGVATDGRIIAVCDTDNNRVLIWNSIPTVNGAPADVVVGQGDFATAGSNFGGAGNTPSNKGLRGPQGVWIQDGKLYVADTQNHRVLVWNSIPTSNGQAADVVLGQPNFTTFVQPDLTQARVNAQANNMLNPVAVTSDGTRLFVTDLGHNRVLVWNSIPTSNAAPADFALGQPDVASTTERTAAAANNSSFLCESKGNDADGKPVYPVRCEATLDFPRFAISDGRRLFVADGGNDRILVWNTMPTASGQKADVVIGQLNGELAQDSETQRISAADTVRTPTAMGWDGRNLYVSDPFNRRVLLFSPGEARIPYTGVRNAASIEIYAVSAVVVSGTIKENDEATVKIGDKEYKYKVKKDDAISSVVRGLVAEINKDSGDPLIIARENVPSNTIVLTAKQPGIAGNDISVTVATSTGATIGLETSGNTRGGGDSAQIAPGTVISIVGDDLADTTATAPDNADSLPTVLGNTEVYVDGKLAPLFYVSPTQINAQMPYEVHDATSVSVWVRRIRPSGAVVTSAIAVPVIPENPGIFAEAGSDPRRAIAFHASSYAQGAISIDSPPKEGDVATIKIEDRSYSYTVQKDDTATKVRDELIARINENADEKVVAFPGGSFTRVRLRSKIAGAEGDAIEYSATQNEGAQIILSAYSPRLCCAAQGGTRLTEDNPALAGEVITIWATGLGFVRPDEAKFATNTGSKYQGPEVNEPNAFVDAIAGGRTAQVLQAGLKPGMIGVYEVVLLLNTDIPTNPQTQLTIAQEIYISNVVTIPVLNPTPEE